MASYELKNIQGDFKGKGTIATAFGGDVLVKIGGKTFKTKTDIARVEVMDVAEKAKFSVGKAMLKGGLAAMATSNWGKNDGFAGFAGGLASGVNTYNANTVVFLEVHTMDGLRFMGETSYEAYQLLELNSPQLDDEEIKEALSLAKKHAAMLDEAGDVIIELQDELNALVGKKDKLQKRIEACKVFDERFKLKEDLTDIETLIADKQKTIARLERHLEKKNSYSLSAIFVLGVVVPFIGMFVFNETTLGFFIFVWFVLGSLGFILVMLSRVIRKTKKLFKKS